MTLYSIDVETSGLIPGMNGVTALSIIEAESGNHFTCRTTLDPAIYVWDDDTATWAQENMPDLSQYPELSYDEAIEGIMEFTSMYEKPHTFMAWPASFDYPMMQHFFGIRHRIKDWPFHYRTLDIKSLMCGKLNVSVDAKRDDLPLGIWIEPDVPHDPYSDALAQLQTYKKLMEHNG